MIDDVLVRYQAEDASHGAGRMSDRRDDMDAHWARIHAENWERLSDRQKRAIRRPPHVHRRFAKHYLRVGDYARAEPHCRAWWLSRPCRPRPLIRWIGCLLRRGGSVDP